MYRTQVRSRFPPLILGLALLVWLALPVMAELRPTVGWNLPAGTVLNADPEPPWPMTLRAGDESALPEAPPSDPEALLPEPARQDFAQTFRTAALSPVLDPARSSSLLILHHRRNE